ncbi:ATP-dependent helicase HrpB [Paenibacillus protaetiae]|uniref:ATP-dependent helicase HrpB n=1 Tax=Paenibacillus protaetiae TaxID=2509456 RepID=A0A4P6ETD6_9BACL|nr:ATP-dependent helicase HrpB [Paenibacillus protaetiae]QAY65695.1 ATP-dependent helicase HrpB [Paenibacillus protaetiae]
MHQLPVELVLPDLLQAMRQGRNAVLVAEPGAGKTTKVPLALLEEPWLQSKAIIMLEPRRLAARSAAAYMSRLLGEQAGGTVGYRVRMDTKVGPNTRIEVVTEGVLTRMLQEDPALERYGAVLFDEFHERHLHGDLGLALTLQSQQLFREDLRLLVMSATLDAGRVSELLGNAPVVQSKGRVFPVETIYANAAARTNEPIETAAAKMIRRALIEQPDGDMLVFLPGVREIRRTAAMLREGAGLGPSVLINELHGTMPLAAQQEAIAPCEPGRRKVVLSTAIAESSLTVEGVRIVVDSGLMRVPRFSPRTGMSRLETIPVSQASADQRRGRAGRTAEGVCYRLWTEHERLKPFTAPEIQDADLAPLALELAVWGAAGPQELAWLDEPPQAAYQQALQLLRLLHALDADGKLTPHGRRMASLGVHPRLAHMLLAAELLGAADEASELAALLSDRDPLVGERSADIELRLQALRTGRGIERGAADRLQQLARQLRGMLRETAQPDSGAASIRAAASGAAVSTGLLLAYAYPDRVAQKRPDGSYLLSGGRGAALPYAQPISRAAYLVAAELDDAGTESTIRLAAELSEEEWARGLADDIVVEETIEWDKAAQAVRARKRTKFGALVLKEQPFAEPDPERVAEVLMAAIRESGHSALPFSKPAKQLLDRMRLMAQYNASWPDANEAALLASLEQWLLPHLYGIRSLAALQKLSMMPIIEELLTWQQRRELDEQVPTHITVPSGSRVPVDYSDPDNPVLSARLQELFGWKETPRIAGGKLPVTLHLLSPSQRPVQVTRDLASFWRDAYFEVKKDLKGRYPKHYWPDDPLIAEPTNRVRPRKPQP